jgi:hypothetical protein
MDFKIFTLEITGNRTGTKPRKRRALRRLVIYLQDSHLQTELQKKHDWILEKSQKYWVYPEPNHKKSQR